MARKKKWSRTRLSLAATLPLALISLVVLAGSSSTTLPNGAELTVSIDDPVTSTEFIVLHDEDSIDVEVSGTASIGLGEPDGTLVYVIDVSGSAVLYDAGGDCGGDVNGDGDPNEVLDCEAAAVLALNAAAIAGGSIDEVGVAVYGETGAAGDMTPTVGDDPITAPDADGHVATVVQSVRSSEVAGDACVNAGLAQFTPKAVGCDGTDFSAGLAAAKTVVDATSNTFKIVAFLSDGLSNQEDAPGFDANLANLLSTGAVIFSFAVGSGSSCGGGSNGTLQQMADASLATNGAGACTEVVVPADLPDILPDLIGSTLESLEIEVDGGGKLPIPDSDLSLPLPQPGAVSVDYTTTVAGLGPGDHEICVTANGSDVTGGLASVTQCETIHLLKLTAGPETEVNELNTDNQHTVTAEIVGGSGPARLIDFLVGGQNAATATPSNASIPADPNVPVDFVYTVPQDCASLGVDTITVSTVIGGVGDSLELSKEWVDTVPPVVSCDPTVNPHGNNEPQAPGQGQNEDGFYQLNAEDPVLANCTVTLQVVDGDGFVFPGPFLPGDNIKYTEANGAPQSQKKMGSGQGRAGAVKYHLIGHGDLTIIATDPSGNTSSDMCLVPPPPK